MEIKQRICETRLGYDFVVCSRPNSHAFVTERWLRAFDVLDSQNNLTLEGIAKHDPPSKKRWCKIHD